MTRLRRYLFTLIAGASFAALSCADPTEPTVSSAPLAPADGWLDDLVRSTGLLTCTPLAPDSVTQDVGPSGGTVVVGPHALVIPPGALTSTVAITGTMQSETVNRVHFAPDGLQFARSASLTMSYANCGLLARLIPKRIAHVSSTLDILSFLPSIDDLLAMKVTGRLDHFSDYAVAW
jgi:hypothetical protein